VSDAQETMKEKTEAAAVTPNNEKRKRMLLGLGAALVLCALGSGVWLLFFAGKSEWTDNAYTNVEVTRVTPLINGPVKQVNVVDTTAVHAGDILIVLDDTDAKIAVAQAEAGLARAKREVRQVMANDRSLGGQEDLREAEISAADADLAKAKAAFAKASIDEKRRQNLVEGGAVSKQELTDAQTQLQEVSAAMQQAQARVTVAHAASSAANGARQANAALIVDSTVDTNPEVLAAAAKLDKAKVDLSRTVIRAPTDGIVTERSVDVGQQVQAGQHLMSLVPVDHIYVDANFKEGQLRKVRPGQAVRVTSDLYGDDVVYDGYVEGFAGGTGSAFSAIPAQNATGNWIKVVQRLPVRIRLDPKQLTKHVLRVGLSMDVTVDLTSSVNDKSTRKD
jgi:membrane fusion protein, multidrug efflux system